MKLDTQKIEGLYKELASLQDLANKKKEEINNLILARLNEVAIVILDTLGYESFDHKGNMLFTFYANCHCIECYGHDSEWNTEECIYDNIISSIENGEFRLSAVRPSGWHTLSTGIKDYREGIPKEFLYMEDHEIRQILENEINRSTARKTKSQLTRQMKKEEKEKAKALAMSKLTDDEKKLLGIKT